MKRSVLIGYEPREHDAYLVAVDSLMRQTSEVPDMFGPLVLADLRRDHLYWRRHIEYQASGQPPRIYDEISDAPMSTEFAISRFLSAHLARTGWVLFVDCDVLFRADWQEIFELVDPSKALMCVKHEHRAEPGTKMDGQAQQLYARKNWSSVMLLNCDHPANAILVPEFVNCVPGRDLHRFCWLADDEIGALPPAWNHLVGIYPPDPEAKLAHFTLGVPSMPGYEDSEFADEWREHAAGRAAMAEFRERVLGRIAE